jgi:UDP-hydrolysing UDP-N-acetyl-D-glucosamine 2-epimerase
VKPRTVAVVTGTRAEFGLLAPVMRAVRAHPGLSLKVLAAGMHFVKDRGLTVREIRRAGFRVDAGVRAPPPRSEPAWMGEALGEMTKGFARVLARLRPDWLLVLGDRAEPLAAALAATELGGIAIAHLHGGEVTGHRLDGQGRRLLTAMAHLHLPATPGSARRLRRMGEAPWRIRRVGAPGLDAIRTLGLPPWRGPRSVLLLIQHAVPHQAAEAPRQIRETLQALDRVGLPVIAVLPNTDAGSDAVVLALKRHPGMILASNLLHAEYLGLLRGAAALVGNSSSGIIEASAFRTPAVNIGIRQAGRERAANVLDAPHRAVAIARAIRRAVSPAFRRRLARVRSPYGDGRTAPRVARLLATFPFDDRLLEKTHA